MRILREHQSAGRCSFYVIGYQAVTQSGRSCRDRRPAPGCAWRRARRGRVSRLSDRNASRTFSAVALIEIAGRFVGQQQRGVVRDRAGDRDALALAARKLPRPVRAAGGEAERVEELVGPLQRGGGRDAGEALGQGDVLAGGEVAEEVVELVDEADPVAPDRGALLVGEGAGVDPGDRPPCRSIGRSRRPAICRRVDLPAPEGATSATSSPRAIARSTPWRTWTVASPSPKRRVTPERRRGSGVSLISPPSARRRGRSSRPSTPGRWWQAATGRAPSPTTAAVWVESMSAGIWERK